ncbi:PPE domain-containing protein [Nocardia sp. 2]|uniref:PPE domain-containing protein n=1 Tax=Nocardia acididurans TaxID=2802282 RepID=A0ABS1LY54_9NOCA|nr:PPE domain-containing protein [Nocardia acididurans]MBL1073317.1 PPE domain-containing protein [Nocardia acididurans]
MTLGITGVFWLPRMAEINSVSLNAGAHAIPISAASTSWTTLTGAWVDATATVARVMAEVGVGLQGLNGLNVLARLTGFTVWAEQQVVMATALAAKTAANATAYTVASIAMPSLPEIAAVEAARVAAHSTGGALNGTAELAEAAKLAMDIRAALVMETYEAATTALVVTPGTFLMPPPIASGAGSADAASTGSEAFGSTDPVSAALATVTSLASNPSLVSGLSQAAQVAGSVVTTGASSVTSVAGNAISSITSAVNAGGTVSPGAGNAGLTTAAGVGAAALATTAVSYGGGSTVSIGNGGGTLQLPQGWGAGAGAATGGAVLGTVAEPATVAQSANGTAPVRNSGTSPVLGSNRGDDEDETHDGNDFGHATDHFAHGGVIAPAVIGGDPAEGR